MPDDELAAVGERKASCARIWRRKSIGCSKIRARRRLPKTLPGNGCGPGTSSIWTSTPSVRWACSTNSTSCSGKLYRLRRERDRRREEDERKSDKEKADAEEDKKVAAKEGEEKDDESANCVGRIARRSGPSIAGCGPIGEMFNGELRRAMRDETQKYFDYVVRENRNVMELIDSNYTFVNETLAKHYGIEGVKGDEMRRVELPAGSPRGGVLTQATFLAVTSNPTRTSPVKRGLFILDNILGFAAVPPPPPNVPLLEDGRDRHSRITSRPFASCRSSIAAIRCAMPATPGWIRWGWRWKTLTHWGCGAIRRMISRSTLRATLLTGEKFDGIRAIENDYQGRAPARFLSLFDGKAANLRPGAGFGVL